MVSFFAEVKILRLWQKTMDYNKAFEVILCGPFTLHWKVRRAQICTILLLLRCSFRWYPFLPKSKFSDFGQKPWTIIRRFHQNRGHSLRSFYSSLEGATSSNLHHSAPLEMLFPMVSFFAEVKIFRFWPKTMDYNKAFSPKSRSFLRSFYSSLEGATELKFAPFCSS